VRSFRAPPPSLQIWKGIQTVTGISYFNSNYEIRFDAVTPKLETFEKMYKHYLIRFRLFWTNQVVLSA
jgi:hypothetical protein